MKALAWQKYLQVQYKLYNKTIFSVAELANVAGTSAHNLNVELARLEKHGIIIRYTTGRYGIPGIASAVELVSSLDPDAYVTAAYALYLHGFITQVPTEIVCFTKRRHNISRVRPTPLGKITFICVKPALYSLPAQSPVSSPEQALCDFIYVMRRRGVSPQSQVTFRKLENINSSVLLETAARYPGTVRKNLQIIFSGKDRKITG